MTASSPSYSVEDFSSRRSHAGNVQAYAVQPRARAEIECLAVSVAPCHVVRVTRCDNRAHVFTFRRDYPKTARPRNIQIALLVHFDSVEAVFASRAGEIEKEIAMAKRAIGLFVLNLHRHARIA